jgi:Tol biopolymer transport system component
VIVGAMLAPPSSWGKAPIGIVRVSVTGSGKQVNGWSSDGSISADAHLVAFQAEWGVFHQVFLRNLKRGRTRLISVSSSGRPGNDDSRGPVLSADGHYLAFVSDATNLVPQDRNRRDQDVFVRNLRTGRTRLVSRSTSGSQGNRVSAAVSLAASGRLVVFGSWATNLVPHDTNGKLDVFARNLRTGTTQRVSVSASGGQADAQSSPGEGAVSADGHRVVFQSSAPLVPGDTNRRRDVFVRNLRTNTTRRVNVSSSGVQANGGSFTGSISPNGRFVTFTSAASNLVPNDTNSIDDAFVHDLRTGRTRLLTVSSSGAQSNFQSYDVFVANNGTRTAFDSGASNLVPQDINHAGDVFVHNTRTGRTHMISRSNAGEQGNGSTYITQLTPDGRFAVFDSEACNLVPHDTNSQQDVFVRGPIRWSHSRDKVEPPGCDPNDPP